MNKLLISLICLMILTIFFGSFIIYYAKGATNSVQCQTEYSGMCVEGSCEDIGEGYSEAPVSCSNGRVCCYLP